MSGRGEYRVWPAVQIVGEMSRQKNGRISLRLYDAPMARRLTLAPWDDDFASPGPAGDDDSDETAPDGTADETAPGGRGRRRSRKSDEEG